MPAPPVLAFAAGLVAGALRPGDRALDGTAGNGHDTAHLARLVGPEGRVFAWDVQAAAIESTRARLLAEGLEGRATLNLGGHEGLGDWLDAAPGRVPLRAAMFNLGYLPGGDRALVTRPGATLPALEAAFARLERGGGVLTVVAYPGHLGGAEEAEAVSAWALGLAPRRAQVLRYEFLDARQPPPFLIAAWPRD